MFVTSQKALLDVSAAVIASILNTATPTHAVFHLAKGAFAPNPTSDPTTFTEADFDGYADKTVTAWSTSYMVPNGAAETMATSVLQWAPTGTTTPNVITGYWIVGGNGDYLGGEAFATPIPLSGPTSQLNLVPIWQQPPGQYSANILT